MNRIRFHIFNKSKNRSINYLIVFLAFITINAFGAVNTSQANTSEFLFSINAQSSVQAADFNHNPFHSPSEPNPLPAEQEDKEEKDNVEEDEWNNSHAYLNYLLGNSGVSRSSEQTFDQFQIALANRDQLALFVLHCSWKSFLS